MLKLPTDFASFYDMVFPLSQDFARVTRVSFADCNRGIKIYWPRSRKGVNVETVLDPLAPI